MVFVKQIYVIRHCEAEGQPFEAQLTENGLKQALNLSEFFSNIKIDKVISSPFKRAIQSIEPLAQRINAEIVLDERLSERVLSTENLPDWFEKLRATYDDLDLAFPCGESSQMAMNRIVAVVNEVFNSNADNCIIVTHGNIMSLLLKFFNNDFGFNDWRKLSNPDVFLLKNENMKITYERLWT